MSKWLKINVAPTDGTILLCLTMLVNGPEYNVGHFDDDDKCWYSEEGADIDPNYFCFLSVGSISNARASGNCDEIGVGRSVAGRRQAMTERVSDEALAMDLPSASWREDRKCTSVRDDYALDLRDARAALATERAARIAAVARADDAQARLAEVETALAEAREALRPNRPAHVERVGWEEDEDKGKRFTATVCFPEGPPSNSGFTAATVWEAHPVAIVVLSRLAADTPATSTDGGAS